MADEVEPDVEGGDAAVGAIEKSLDPSPVPVRVACCGLEGSFSATDRVAFSAAPVDGVKVTLIVQKLVGGIEPPHVSVDEKSAALAPEKLIATPVTKASH